MTRCRHADDTSQESPIYQPVSRDQRMFFGASALYEIITPWSGGQSSNTGCSVRMYGTARTGVLCSLCPDVNAGCVKRRALYDLQDWNA